MLLLVIVNGAVEALVNVPGPFQVELFMTRVIPASEKFGVAFMVDPESDKVLPLPPIVPLVQLQTLLMLRLSVCPEATERVPV